MQFGEKLKAIRKANGLSLKQLSLLTEEKVSVSFLSDIENGRSKPSINNLKVIANALNTPISYFLEDSEKSPFSETIEDIDFIPVAELLKDFSDWNIEDKKELLYYLKAKKLLRDNK